MAHGASECSILARHKRESVYKRQTLSPRSQNAIKGVQSAAQKFLSVAGRGVTVFFFEVYLFAHVFSSKEERSENHDTQYSSKDKLLLF